MRYLLMIGGEETATSRTSAEICASDDALAWANDLERRGKFLGGEVLRPASDATTVRVRDGQVLLSDGPFAETKEQIGGYCLVECANLDEALTLAATHPVAKFGLVEVRAIWEDAQ
jgi:hypothetical protein